MMLMTLTARSTASVIAIILTTFLFMIFSRVVFCVLRVALIRFLLFTDSKNADKVCQLRVGEGPRITYRLRLVLSLGDYLRDILFPDYNR